MIKILKEYSIRNQNQKDIVLDRLYNDIKLRRYEDVIDCLVETVDNDLIDGGLNPDKDLESWFYDLLDVSVMKKIYITKTNPWYDIFCDIFNIDKIDENACEELNNKINEILEYIGNILTNDKTLKTDLFYTLSDSEADINNNDWNDIEQIVNRIAKYTTGYDVSFTNEEAELIKKHMKKTNKPLYRIEQYNGWSPFLQYKRKEIETIEWKDEKSKGIKSFTEDLECEPMINMQKIRGRDSGYSGIIIYETIGETYSLNIDVVSQNNVGAANLEYEHLVSGEFEIVKWWVEQEPYIDDDDDDDDWEDSYGSGYDGKITWVQIKQIHK